MAPVATPFFFYLFAAIMLIGGILVITRKNPVHSALALIVTLLAQASIYLMLYAPFVAGVQIILYAGGIMVLFLFVIMLVSIDRTMKERQFNSQWVVGMIAATVLGGLFIAVYTKGTSIFPEHALSVVENDNTQQVATMLYGHIETLEERVDHLIRLRELQDETQGFQCFIPLAFHPENTFYASLPPTTGLDDLRTIAVSRLMLDNFPHIKAYWVTLTPDLAQVALRFGADDLYGTIATAGALTATTFPSASRYCTR